MTDTEFRTHLDVLMRELRSEVRRIEECIRYVECIRPQIGYAHYSFLMSWLNLLNKDLERAFLNFSDYRDLLCDTPQQ